MCTFATSSHACTCATSSTLATLGPCSSSVQIIADIHKSLTRTCVAVQGADVQAHGQPRSSQALSRRKASCTCSLSPEPIHPTSFRKIIIIPGRCFSCGCSPESVVVSTVTLDHAGQGWKNRTPARILLQISFNRPIRSISKVSSVMS